MELTRKQIMIIINMMETARDAGRAAHNLGQEKLSQEKTSEALTLVSVLKVIFNTTYADLQTAIENFKNQK